ncbi:MAG: response regulator [Nodosilinea sp.]
MSKRILVIDDELDIREVVCIALEEFGGWQPASAASGREGLAQAQSATWDAILLDVSMPDIDGLEVFEHLRSHPQTDSVPVILLTAKVQPSDLSHFAALGVAGVIAKPFDPVTVWQQVALILGWPV